MGGQNAVDIETYTKLFGYGSSPANWEGQDIPSIESIKEDLKQFQIVLVNLLMNNYHKNLNNRLLVRKTLNELLVLNAIHVPLHAGKIEEMARVLKQAK